MRKPDRKRGCSFVLTRCCHGNTAGGARMRKPILMSALAVIAALAFAFSNHTGSVKAQQRTGLTPEQVAQRHALEKELQSIAIVDRKLMIPMRDGVRIAADVYRPKDTSKKYPTVFVDRKSTRLNSSHSQISYAVFCLKKK